LIVVAILLRQEYNPGRQSIYSLQGKVLLGTLHTTSSIPVFLKTERWGVPLIQAEKYQKNTETVAVDNNTLGLDGYVTGR
jgi:hypothetical protein